jgi:hypothetical protein
MGDNFPLIKKWRTMSGDLERGKTQIHDIISENEVIFPPEDKSPSLPSPATVTFSSIPPKSRPSSPNSSQILERNNEKTKIHLKLILLIPIWVILNLGVIISNNYIWHTLDFKFPLFLIAWQFTFTSVGMCALARTMHLLDGTTPTNLTMEIAVNWIFPIAALYPMGLMCSSFAYAYFSSGHIQVLQVRRA